MDSTIEARVSALEAENLELRARVARLERQRLDALTAGDLDYLSQRFLPVVEAKLGSDPCFSWEFTESDDPDLRAATAGWSTQRLGALLGRAVDVPIGRYVIVRAGKVGNAVRWSVRATWEAEPTGPTPDTGLEKAEADT